MKKLINKLAIKALALTDRAFASSRNPLLRGDLVAYGREGFDPADYQTMWMDIPEDIQRRITWDGRLLNGDMPAELAKERFTDELMMSMMVKSGKKALTITTVIGVVVALMTIPNFSVAFTGQTAYPTWAAESGVWLPVAAWYLLTVIERVGGLVGAISVSMAMLLPLLLLFPVFWWWGFSALCERMWRKYSVPYRYPTADTQHFWKERVADRIKDYDAYKGMVAEAFRIADKPLIPVGIAAGLTDARGDNLGPLQGQIVCLDGDSLAQHVLILGRTGAQKTRLAFTPLFKWVVSDIWGSHKKGAYVTDGKAVLWREMMPHVAHRKDVKVIGVEPGQFGIDLIRGMSPTEVSAMFEAVDGQGSAKSSEGDFWSVSASDAILKAAQVAYILDRHKGVCAEWREELRVRPYSLYSIFNIATDPHYMARAAELFLDEEIGQAIVEAIDADDQRNLERFVQAQEAALWFKRVFLMMSDGQRDGIIGHVAKVLGKLRSSRTVVDRFCSGDSDESVDVDYALNGGILMIAMGSAGELGEVGRLMAVWLKTRLIFLAARRLEQDALNGTDVCKRSSCGLFADEFQMLATTGGGDKSDAEAWNWARASGLHLVAATQNISALRLKMGDTAAANFLLQMNSKIVLEIDERETIEWVEKTSGSLPDGWQTDPRFYSTQAKRELLTGNWTEDADPEIWDYIHPTVMIPITDQVVDGWGGQIKRISKVVGLRSMRSKKGVEQYTIEGQGEAGHLSPGSSSFRIRQSDLQTGSGYAVCFIRRANATRVDLLDLRINEPKD